MTTMHENQPRESVTSSARVCLRCSAAIDATGDYCAACIGTFKATAWQAWETLETYEATIGPVPSRPDDEPDDEPEDAA